MRSNKEKVTYQNTQKELIVDNTTGEVTQEAHKTSKTIRFETEPPYIKLYLDCLSRFKDMQVSFNPILVEFLKRASYADDLDGGQIIFTNKGMKDIIAKNCNVSYKRVEQALTEFVKKDIFKRVALACYQVNPYLFGKGDWKNIKNIRATFNFGTGEALAEIVKNEEKALDDAYNNIAKQM